MIKGNSHLTKLFGGLRFEINSEVQNLTTKRDGKMAARIIDCPFEFP